MTASGCGENHCADILECRHEGLFMTSWSVGDFGYINIISTFHISFLFSFWSSAPLSSSSLLLLLLDSLTASSVDVLNAVNIVSLALWISGLMTRPARRVAVLPQWGQLSACPKLSGGCQPGVAGWWGGDKRGGKVQLALFTLLCVHLGNCTYSFCFFVCILIF